MNKRQRIVHWTESKTSVNEEWEKAYNSFESKKEEIEKFERRFEKFGLQNANKDSYVLDLFCGSGSSLQALSNLGFKNLYGVDLSYDLLKKCKVNAQLFVGDCRYLKFEKEVFDIVIIQGGLHHLPDLDNNLPILLDGVKRVLRKDGLVLIVEPWLTPFLRLLHLLYHSKFLRSVWPKFDALATMTELEFPIYDNWISNPKLIRDNLSKRFTTMTLITKRAKLNYIGKKQ